LDSSTLLLQAASGLEKLMSGTKTKSLKDSTVAQVSAALFYQSNVMAKMISDKDVQKKFTKVIFEQIEKDFGMYIDSQARSKPKQLHHVYEWKRVGNSSARLFDLKLIDEYAFSFKLTYAFKDSKSFVPNNISKRKHVFKNKAAIMEAGMPLTIAPRAAERLVFESSLGGITFMPKGASVTVKKPGGVAVKQSFETYYKIFFKGNLVNLSIKKSGFQKIFGATTAKAMKLPANIKKVSYSFSPNTVRSQAELAVKSAVGMV
jgi:hypothetical protein